MRRVILESPYSGDTLINVRYARLCIRHCLMMGDSPIASHLLFTQEGILDDDDPEQRDLGINAGLFWGDVAHATVCYVDLGISGGMRIGWRNARHHGRSIEIRSLSQRYSLSGGASDTIQAVTTKAMAIWGGGDIVQYDRYCTELRSFLRDIGWSKVLPFKAALINEIAQES